MNNPQTLTETTPQEPQIPIPSPSSVETLGKEGKKEEGIPVEGSPSMRERHRLGDRVSPEEARRLVESINSTGRGDARLLEREGRQVLALRELLVD